MLACCSSLSSAISRMVVPGMPSSSASRRIFFSATISPVSKSLAYKWGGGGTRAHAKKRAGGEAATRQLAAAACAASRNAALGRRAHALYTTPYVPSPTFSSLRNRSTTPAPPPPDAMAPRAPRSPPAQLGRLARAGLIRAQCPHSRSTEIDEAKLASGGERGIDTRCTYVAGEHRQANARVERCTEKCAIFFRSRCSECVKARAARGGANDRVHDRSMSARVWCVHFPETLPRRAARPPILRHRQPAIYFYQETLFAATVCPKSTTFPTSGFRRPAGATTAASAFPCPR